MLLLLQLLVISVTRAVVNFIAVSINLFVISLGLNCLLNLMARCFDIGEVDGFLPDKGFVLPSIDSIVHHSLEASIL